MFWVSAWCIPSPTQWRHDFVWLYCSTCVVLCITLMVWVMSSQACCRTTKPNSMTSWYCSSWYCSVTLMVWVIFSGVLSYYQAQWLNIDDSNVMSSQAYCSDCYLYLMVGSCLLRRAVVLMPNSMNHDIVLCATLMVWVMSQACCRTTSPTQWRHDIVLCV